MYHNTDPDPKDPAGGGGGGAPPTKKADDKPKPHQFTDEELEARLEAARKAERDSAAEAARKKKEEDDRKAAEEEGRYKDLLESEKGTSAGLRSEISALKLSIALRDHLAEKHPDYTGVAKYILPTIPADTKEADFAKAVETAATQYVTDNPREKKGGAGAPAKQPVTGNRMQGGGKPAASDNGNAAAHRRVSAAGAF
jgi:hypothetical protein